MSYTITLTNGTIKTEVADGQINQVATDLTLIGKNTKLLQERMFMITS